MPTDRDTTICYLDYEFYFHKVAKSRQCISQCQARIQLPRLQQYGGQGPSLPAFKPVPRVRRWHCERSQPVMDEKLQRPACRNSTRLRVQAVRPL